MRNQKGFTFVELLAVIVLLALLIAIIAPTILLQIDRARADTILAEARAVSTAATAVLIKNEGAGVTDLQLAEGLTGIINDAAYPVQTRISKEMNAYLSPDMKLSDEPSETEGKVSVTIENGRIVKVVYEKIIGKKLRIATLDGGDGKVKSQKIVKKTK